MLSRRWSGMGRPGSTLITRSASFGFEIGNIWANMCERLWLGLWDFCLAELFVTWLYSQNKTAMPTEQICMARARLSGRCRGHMI